MWKWSHSTFVFLQISGWFFFDSRSLLAFVRSTYILGSEVFEFKSPAPYLVLNRMFNFQKPTAQFQFPTNPGRSPSWIPTLGNLPQLRQLGWRWFCCDEKFRWIPGFHQLFCQIGFQVWFKCWYGILALHMLMIFMMHFFVDFLFWTPSFLGFTHTSIMSHSCYPPSLSLRKVLGKCLQVWQAM